MEPYFFCLPRITPWSFIKRNVRSQFNRVFFTLGFWLLLFHFNSYLLYSTPPNHIISVWNKFLDEACHLQKLHIAHHVIPNNSLSCSLHGFCDTSEFVHASGVYLCCIHHDNSIIVHFLSAKTQLAPVKKLSITRLEPCGASLLSKLMKYVL